MRLLLDTHTFLWFITADAQLSSTAENAIRKLGTEAFLSIASVWEIAIKVNLGRLPIPQPLETFIPSN
jgi:PIN domain nuclease of toxin-antitoxin system